MAQTLSLIRPGHAFDVLLDRDSRRKISSVVAFTPGSDERGFGADGANQITKTPLGTFGAVKLLLAQNPSGVGVSRHKETYGLDLIPGARGGVEFVREPRQKGKKPKDAADEKEGPFSVEEILGMQFEYARGLAEEAFKGAVKDAVVTVPAHFTVYQRQAIVDAMSLAGLKVLGMIHDGSAVALNYAMTRTFSNDSANPDYHLVYDAGAGSVKASLFAFTSINSTTRVVATAVESEPNVGGLELDGILREIIAKAYEEKHGEKVKGWRDNARAWAKALKEAQRIKHILSANPIAPSSVESLYGDYDHRCTVTRESLEEIMIERGLADRFVAPVTALLQASNIPLDKISSVILTGGTSRVPLIQSRLKDIVSDEKLATNVNADEAAVLGAAFYGATLSRQFKTKALKLIELIPQDIQVTHPGNDSVTQEIIFKKGSPSNVRKSYTFNRTTDFEIKVAYANPPEGVPAQFMNIKFSGLPDIFANLTSEEKKLASVRVQLLHSDSGIVSVAKSDVWIPGAPAAAAKEPSITGRLKKLFKSSEASDDLTEEEIDDLLKDIDIDNSTTSKNKSLPKERSWRLKSLISPVEMPPLDSEQKSAASSKMRALTAQEKASKTRAEAMNQLESYLYRMRDILAEEVGHEDFYAYSTAKERKSLETLLDETLAFMDQESFKATTETLKSKQSALSKIENPIRTRAVEDALRKENTPLLQQAIRAGRIFVESAGKNITADKAEDKTPKYTEEEVQEVEEMIDKHEKWLKEKMEEQKDLALNEDPVLLGSDMEWRGRQLQNQVTKLTKRVKPTRIRIPLDKLNATASANKSSSAKSKTNSTAQNQTSTELPTDAEPTTPIKENQPVLEDDNPADIPEESTDSAEDVSEAPEEAESAEAHDEL